jgi:hypothetical protein
MLLLTLLIVFGLVPQVPAAPRSLPFADKGWDLVGATTAIVVEDGRDVLHAETGFAFRRDVLLEDGTIDCEVRVTDRRSFVYVYFRAAADGEREEIYLRPHKSGLPDAIQYAPVWQGKSAWQLYHGPGATAAPAFRHGEWARLRVVLQGRRAAVFLDDMTVPVLVIPRMARDPQAGYIALGGFLPAGTPGSGPIAQFANVSVQPGYVPFDFEPALRSLAMAKPAPADPGIVRTWSISGSFAVPSDAHVLPGPSVTGAFGRVDAEASGLVPLHRHIKVPATGATAAVAKVTVRATAAGLYAFDLGFSDMATVFVNGRPLFHGDQRYSFDAPRREGLIGYDQARLYLPLQAGDNELVVMLGDSFGGWGLMGRFVDATGLSVMAR